jgi:hypothetical protein
MAPSWSWAACDGAIVLRGRSISTLQIEEMAKITGVEKKRSTENITGTGLTSDGALILEELLKKPFRITVNPAYRSQQGCRDVQLRAPSKRQEEPGIPPYCKHELRLDYKLSAEQTNNLVFLPLRRTKVESPKNPPDRTTYRIQGLAVV